MTTTTTATATATAVAVPEPAATVSSAYYELLEERLPQASTRADAAAIVAAMAGLADRVAAGLYGSPAAEEGTVRDPLAWLDLAAHLDQLAAALKGSAPVQRFDFGDDVEACDVWADLAQTLTRQEFAAVWSDMRRTLTTSETSGDEGAGEEGEPLLRAFAVTGVLATAAAVIDASW